MFHTINNHGRRIAAFGNRLNQLGILPLMVDATIPTVYYGLYDDIELCSPCWCVVSVLEGLGCVATMDARFRILKFRPWRSIIYATLGLSTIFFTMHAIILKGLG